jgi:Ser/Thr protein kinase RdoA (MazF antagonist)
MEVFREASRRVRLDLDRLGYAGGAFSVIHRDLTLKNLLFGDGEVGATDFDLCGLAHYHFDLSVVLRALGAALGRGRRREGRLERSREALFEGYASVRALPGGHGESLTTFDAMQKVAAVNRTLGMRASEATRPRARGEPFLRGAVAWLEANYLR